MQELTNRSQITYSPEIVEGVRNSPGVWGIKDTDSLVLVLSPLIKKLIGEKPHESVEGISDYMARCDAAEFADHFIMQDQRVIRTRQPYRYLSVCHYDGQVSTHFAQKKLLVNKANEPFGTISHCEELYSDQSITILKLLLRSPLITYKKNNQLILEFSEPENYPKLSDRQKEILFLILRGRTTKEIAKILSLSPRTVEDHIHQLKNKFQCENKSQMIDKAYCYNWHTYVPFQIMKKYKNF